MMAAFFLYFFRLASVGMIGPDEPRYASIGFEMARSGDWVTPRLWGAPWFEKPALLYWLTGAAYRLGLREEWAPRLPVALISVGFLLLYYRVLRREFGSQAAWFAVGILGTSAGWIAYSRVAVTDLPMTAAFAAAMLLALPWIDRGDRGSLPVVGALLGVAVLAKGLVPIALMVPLVVMGWRRLQDLIHPRTSLPFILVATPWYLLCYWQNGMPFLREFFWEHHIERVASETLRHVQPFWFYVPVLAGALYPWTPVLGGLFTRRLFADRKRKFLLFWLLFGFAFFSVPLNKLPGYLLPLLPAAAALMGIALSERKGLRWALVGSAGLLLLMAPAAAILPRALASGLSRAGVPVFHWIWLAPALLIPLVWREKRRSIAVGVIAAGVTAGVAGVALRTLPDVDRIATIRPLWREVKSRRDQVCVGDLHRSLRYGLNFYSGTPIPDCGDVPNELAITGKDPPRLTPRGNSL